MSDRDWLLDTCSEFETLLAHKFGSSGRGLGEKAKNLGPRLPPTVLALLAELTRPRNRFAHKPGMTLTDSERERVRRVAEILREELTALGQFIQLAGSEFKLTNKAYGIPFDCYKKNRIPPALLEVQPGDFRRLRIPARIRSPDVPALPDHFIDTIVSVRVFRSSFR